MNLLTIQLVDDTNNRQPAGQTGQAGQQARSPQPSAESYTPRQQPEPFRPQSAAGDLTKQILATPGAKQFGFTPSVLAGMSPEAVEDLARKLGIGPHRPTAAAANAATPPAPPVPPAPPAGGGSGGPPAPGEIDYVPGMEPPGYHARPRAEPVAPRPRAGGGAGVGGGLGVGVALVAAELAARQVAKSFDKLGEAATAAGQTAQQLAGNRNLGALTTAVDGAASALGAVPVVGQVFESGLKSATATVRAFAGAVEAFTNRGRELSAYNAKLAESNARQDLARLQADIREAQQLGPTLAALTDKVTELENMGREALLPIKEVVAGFLVEVLTVVRDASVGFLEFLKASRLVPQAVSDWAEKVLKALKDAKQPADILAAWMSAADALGPGVLAPDPAAQAANAKLAAPIFG